MERFTDGNATFGVEVQDGSGPSPFLCYLLPQGGSLRVPLSPLVDHEMAEDILAMAASGPRHFLSETRAPLGETPLGVWHVELAGVLRGQGVPADMALYLGHLLGRMDWGATVVPTLLGLGVEVHDEVATGLNSVEVFARTILLVGEAEAVRLFTARGRTWGEQRALLGLLAALGEMALEHLPLVDLGSLDALAALVDLGNFQPQEVSALVSLMGLIAPHSLPRMGEVLAALGAHDTLRLAELFPEGTSAAWEKNLDLLHALLRPRVGTAPGHIHHLHAQDRVDLERDRDLLLAPLLVAHGLGGTMAALGSLVEEIKLGVGSSTALSRAWDSGGEGTPLALECQVPIPLLMAAANGLADMGNGVPLVLILGLADMDMGVIDRR